MGDTKKHTVKIKPSKKDIERTYEGFDELKELIAPSSNKPEAGFYILNEGKWFDEDWFKDWYKKYTNSFFKFEIENGTNTNLTLERKPILKQIETKLSQKYYPSTTDLNWKKRPEKVYDCNATNKDFFHRGHLIGCQLIEYSKIFKHYKWENFVMITDWCNRANTYTDNNKSCGMFYFENILLQTLDFYYRNKEHIEIDYRITPVLKKLDSKNEQQNYEKLPRGIIMEARVRNGGNFLTSNDEKHPIFESGFNVFIPNAQKNLKIDYNSGEVIKE
ncbi:MULTISPECIES: hypothetical protein [unclassified Streptococcus]|uniref:hypothetical protein n=1 Tax=unclassified Streptococcus TaxID=2608887 RepID=UPI0010722D83|nr:MULTISPECIES: hypothetical protein [unclassified Streptococcus]MBF0805230.1 hypothetical protein [Streptococcus sp. 19428wA2_WM07]TFU29268.1 hypothetical protein E4T71_00200 [Streptococcus sp. WM07]